jgi:hypothetical protein
MTQLDLSREEAEALLQALQYYHAELRMEIAGTDALDFREQLKTQKQVLKGVRERLQRLIVLESGERA